jgi:hypothetical protein
MAAAPTKDTGAMSLMPPPMAGGLLIAQGSKVKPAGWVRAAQTNQREG